MKEADHRGSEAGLHGGEFAVVKHAVGEAEIAGLPPHPLHPRAALFKFGLAETERCTPLGRSCLTAIPVRASSSAAIHPPSALSNAGNGVPTALALHPDQSEIAARRVVGDIPFVKQRSAKAFAGDTVSDRRTDQPTADHDHIKARHRTNLSEPAGIRSAAASGKAGVRLYQDRSGGAEPTPSTPR
jgi:hypothetical protein